MEDCKKCWGEGLIHQGESIHKLCDACGGKGKVGELSELNEETNMEPEEEVVAPAEEVAVEEAPAEEVAPE